MYCDIADPRDCSAGGGGFTLPVPSFLLGATPAALATLRSWGRPARDVAERDMEGAGTALDMVVEYLHLDRKMCPFKDRKEWAPLLRQVLEWAKEGRAQVRQYKTRLKKNREASAQRRAVGTTIDRPPDALTRVPITKTPKRGPLEQDLRSAALNEPVLVTDLHMLHGLSDAEVVRAWGSKCGVKVRNERTKFRKRILAGLPFPTMLFRMPRGYHGSREASQWFVWRVGPTKSWPQPLHVNAEAIFWAAHREIEDTIMKGVERTAPRVVITRLLLKLRAAGARPALVEAVLNDPEYRPGLYISAGAATPTTTMLHVLDRLKTPSASSTSTRGHPCVRFVASSIATNLAQVCQCCGRLQGQGRQPHQAQRQRRHALGSHEALSGIRGFHRRGASTGWVRRLGWYPHQYNERFHANVAGEVHTRM